MRGIIISVTALSIVVALFLMMQSLAGLNPADTQIEQKVIPAPDFVDIESLNLPNDYRLPVKTSAPQESPKVSLSVNQGSRSQLMDELKSDLNQPLLEQTIEFSPLSPSLPIADDADNK